MQEPSPTERQLFFAYLIGAIVIYLKLVERAKNLFHARFAKHGS